MKKTYKVKVEAKVPLMVYVEADDHEQALQVGAARARFVLEREMPHRKDGGYQYVGVEAYEVDAAGKMNA